MMGGHLLIPVDVLPPVFPGSPVFALFIVFVLGCSVVAGLIALLVWLFRRR